MPAAQSGTFGAGKIKPHPGFMALINSHSKLRKSRLDRAPCQEYADELCTYKEPDAWDNSYTTCRYMTLGAFFSGLGEKRSFEEVRLATYKLGLIDGDKLPKLSGPSKSSWQAPSDFRDLIAQLDGPRTRPDPRASRRHVSGKGWGSTNLLPSQAVDRANPCSFPCGGQPKSESAEAQDLAALTESALRSSKAVASTDNLNLELEDTQILYQPQSNLLLYRLSKLFLS
jgi:hypothetical protein